MNTWWVATFAAETLALQKKKKASWEQVELYIKLMLWKLFIKMGLIQQQSIHFDKLLPFHIQQVR